MSSSPETHFDKDLESVAIENEASPYVHTRQSWSSESIPTETMSCEDLAEWLNLKGIPESFCSIIKGVANSYVAIATLQASYT